MCPSPSIRTMMRNLDSGLVDPELRPPTAPLNLVAGRCEHNSEADDWPHVKPLTDPTMTLEVSKLLVALVAPRVFLP